MDKLFILIDFRVMNSQLRHQILSILARDSKTPLETVAKLTGQPLEDVRSAVCELEESGLIKRYTAIVDWEKAGVDKVVAFIDVKVTPARDVGFDAIAARIARYPQVESVWLVSGGSDLRVVVEAPNLRELATFVSEKLATIDGVNGTVTHFLLKRYKEDGVLFVDQDKDNRLVVSP